MGSGLNFFPLDTDARSRYAKGMTAIVIGEESHAMSTAPNAGVGDDNASFIVAVGRAVVGGLPNHACEPRGVLDAAKNRLICKSVDSNAKHTTTMRQRAPIDQGYSLA